LLGHLLAAFRSLTLRGPRAAMGLAAALAVGIAVTLALMLRLQAPYWAGISAFICMQASQPQSLRKALHRILGTLLGAAAALLIFPWIAYDHLATMLLLFLAGTMAILGALLSTYSYAWLFRAAEITLGSATALAVAYVMLPGSAGPVVPGPGWRSLLGRNAHMLPHATRAGLTIALVPLVWRIFELPNLGQMAISISVIMAVPVLTGDPHRDSQAIAQRAAERVTGCILGAGAGLAVLALPCAMLFPFWLAALMLAAWISAQLETGPNGMPNVGIQSMLAFILTVVQGWGPALSLTPAIERAAGMVLAISMLLAINLILGPPKAATA
jgi:uncharacterized membrane protein YccC